MTHSELEKVIIQGIFTLGNHILNSPDLLHLRIEMVDDNRVLLNPNVLLYIDKNGIWNNFQQNQYEMRSTAFATLMTPICDITVSQGEVYSVSFKHVHDIGVFPQEIDIEEVLAEVDRTAFSDTAFNTARVVRLSRQRLDPRYSRSKIRTLI